MTKHRMIIGFVAVVLLAVVALTITSRSHSADPAIVSSAISLKELTGDHNRLPTEDFHDHSLVFPREKKQ
jgi:hypothetical protein